MKQTKLDLIKYRIERAKETIDEAILAIENKSSILPKIGYITLCSI